MHHLTTTAGCQIAGPIGVAVQLLLGILVLFVLIGEYIWESISAKCNHDNDKARSFRTWWFDSYKICTGALVSHFYNIAVAVYIQTLNKSVDECAVYALAFYYEASGVPFVQLIQYSTIQYATRISSNQINNTCKQRWKWISKPGIYDSNRYPVKNCIECKHCDQSNVQWQYFNLSLVFLGSFLFALFIGYLSYLNDNKQNDWYNDGCVVFLSFVFIFSTCIAPISSLWQTLQWISCKLFEKTIWSLIGMAQGRLFAEWSIAMSTGNVTLDALLYLAIVPIILNGIMFFMYSRISRLKLPCFGLETENNGVINDNNISNFDKQKAYKIGVGFMLIFNLGLYIFPAVYLAYLGEYNSIWILFISMILIPGVFAVSLIHVFDYIINNDINVCSNCCGTNHHINNRHLDDKTPLKQENNVLIKTYSAVNNDNNKQL